MSGERSDDEWRFSVDEFDDESVGDRQRDRDGTVEGVDAEAERQSESSVAGEFSPTAPVLPERPDPENAAFVTLGVAVTILVIVSMVGGPSVGLWTSLAVLAAIGLLGTLAYAAFVRLTPDT